MGIKTKVEKTTAQMQEQGTSSKVNFECADKHMGELTLESLGWDGWFEAQAKSTCDKQQFAARVAAVDRDQLLLLDGNGSFRAKLSGKFMYESDTSSERPCVGDWVCVQKPEHEDFGMIHGVIKRRTCLRRKSAGESIEYQMIAANMDFVIIVQSCHYDFNLKRLERYLVMIKDGGATAFVLLTKTDLVTAEVLEDQIEQIENAGITGPVATLSNVTKEGFDELRGILTPGRTYCFVGSSGVGKSTVINNLAGQHLLETKAVSGTGEGRHTSVRRELVLVENGALVIDNPGMREFGVFGAEDGIEASYSDILTLASQCRFRDCTHSNEPGCAVLNALKRGEIDAGHYDNFIKLRRESDHYMLSYADKRKKDREFGRFIKSAKKELEDK